MEKKEFCLTETEPTERLIYYYFFLQKCIVKEHGIHLSKLIYLSKEEFKFLRHLRFCFLKRARSFFKKQPKAESSAKKQALQRPTTKDLAQGNGKIYPCYEATPMHYTRDSLFWGWRRVKEYFRDLLDMDNISATREVYALINT